MRRLAIALGVSALAMGASTAQAADPPEVNCGIVSCTYVIEEQVRDLQECIENGKAALREVLEGTPQPQTCDL